MSIPRITDVSKHLAPKVKRASKPLAVPALILVAAKQRRESEAERVSTALHAEMNLPVEDSGR